MNDKAWAFFSLTILMVVLGFAAGMAHEYGISTVSFGGAGCAALLTWAMTTY